MELFEAYFPEKSNQYTCDKAGKIQKREIREYSPGADNGRGNKELAYVMENPTYAADRNHREAQRFNAAQPFHGKQTQDTAGQTVKQSKQIAKSKSIQDIADEGDAKRSGKAGAVHKDYDNQIGEAELDSGERNWQGK